MKHIILGLFTIATLTFVAWDKNEDTTPKTFTIKSADITNVFGADNFGNASTGGTCTGANKSPQLTWENAPSGTKSFAITMIDLNAFGPNIPFDHWLVINIPSSTTSLIKDAGNISKANLPSGSKMMPNGAYPTYVTNAEYVRAYAGVCPNVGNTNQYEITVYALNTATLNVSDTATSSQVKTAIQAATISSTKMSVTATR